MIKLLRLAFLILAFACFVAHIVFDGWRPVPVAGASVSRPSFLGMGLALWVMAEIVS